MDSDTLQRNLKLLGRLHDLVELLAEKRRSELAVTAQEHQLTERDIRILQLLDRAPASTVTFGDIMASLVGPFSAETNKSTVSQALKRMAERGLLTRDYNPTPQQPRIQLTPVGKSTAQRIDAVENLVQTMAADCLGLTGDEARSLEDAIEHCVSRFRRHTGPSPARIYDYLIGGTHHLVVDRDAAAHFLKLIPEVRDAAISNRAFLRRAVLYLARDEGIRQFVDVGSGMPTMGNTHEIVRQVDARSRVMYVDRDREAVQASKLLLLEEPHVVMVQGDIRDPEGIWDAPERKDFIDLRTPVAVICVALLHFVPDDAEALQCIKGMIDPLPAGSFLVMSHAVREAEMATRAEELERLYRDEVGVEVKLRRREAVQSLFYTTKLIDGDLMYAPDWRPGIEDLYLPPSGIPFRDNPSRSMALVGVGRKG